MSFENLNLHESLVRATSACGYTAPTQIQRDAIPVVLAGRDLMASAQTGTGKTAAFVLPALQRLLTNPAKPGIGPRVLVLTPTRELATQVSDNIRSFGKFTRVVFGNVVGGMPYPPQIQMLRRPLDILVATPGRLIDHIEQGRIDFSRLEMLVLDEADRMLDMGFIDEVKMVAKLTPKDRQTLLFSATLQGKVLEVARTLLTNPAQVELAAIQEKHADITQHLHQADNLDHKNKLLSHLLRDDALSQAVIFTGTKRSADSLAKALSAQGHTASALHGDMKQSLRKRTVDQMRSGKFRLLVATDVAARGLDIKGISHVINYDLPMVAEDYVHRIGRTGRGGAQGIAVSLVGPDDWSKLGLIERLTGHSIERVKVEGLEPRFPEPRGSRSSAPSRSRKYGSNSSGPRRSEGNGASPYSKAKRFTGKSAARSEGGPYKKHGEARA